MNTELSKHLFIERLDAATLNVLAAATHWDALHKAGMSGDDDAVAAIGRLAVEIFALLRMDAIDTKREDGPE